MKLTTTIAICLAVLVSGSAGYICGPYQFMTYVGSGAPTSSCSGPDSFAAASNAGQGYVAMYSGCHWGSCSPDTTFPRLVKDLGNISTTFASTITADATHYDETYDIWFDELEKPNGRNARYELMVWTQWVGNQPLAKQYNAQGLAVPTLKGVVVAGMTWDFYYCNPGGGGENGPTYSFLRTPMATKVQFRVADFSDWLIANGYMPSGLYCTSVQAGWEFNTNGAFTATQFSITANTVDVCANNNGGCGPVATTKCAEVSGKAQCTCVTGYSGNPPALPCAPNGGACPIKVKDLGAGAWWMPYSVSTSIAGRNITSVRMQGAASAFSGPFNWGDGPTIFTYNPPSGGHAPFVMLVTDSAGVVYPVNIAGFDAAFAYSC